MALKKLVDVGEKFPTVKRARLGAAPPIEDVLDNVGAPELPPPTSPPDAAITPEQSQGSQTDAAPRAKTTAKKKESTGRRGGQGIHKGAGTDARRYRKSGRTFPWGVRVHPDMAERVKVMAGEKVQRRDGRHFLAGGDHVDGFVDFFHLLSSHCRRPHPLCPRQPSLRIAKAIEPFAGQVAPGWDKYYLEAAYKEFVSRLGEMPRNPDRAFLGWARKFTKGKRPS